MKSLLARADGYVCQDCPTKKEITIMVDQDVVEGKIKQGEGKVQDGVGDVTGDAGDNLAGKAKQVEGKVQEGFGKAKEAVRDALNKDQV